MPTVRGTFDGEQLIAARRHRRVRCCRFTEQRRERILGLVVEVVLPGEGDDLVDGERGADRLDLLGGEVSAEADALDLGSDVLAELGHGDRRVVVKGLRSGLAVGASFDVGQCHGCTPWLISSLLRFLH
ncbi:Uncharacterised protein [Mycobacteroides abscessus subsp. abscessus]|nr:Uncharacterised protein [Mycobacteroides abscessus subsp. abscessus]